MREPQQYNDIYYQYIFVKIKQSLWQFILSMKHVGITHCNKSNPSQNTMYNSSEEWNDELYHT